MSSAEAPKSSIIKVRFNTAFQEADDPSLKWRVLENGQEKLAREIIINVPSWTSHDFLQSGIEKWHITCDGRIRWDGECAIIEGQRP
jgi:hypothetical protein